MASQAYLHLNGVSYELPFQVESDHDAALQSVKQQVENLTRANGHVQIFDLRVEGSRCELHVSPSGVGTIGVYVKDPSLVW